MDRRTNELVHFSYAVNSRVNDLILDADPDLSFDALIDQAIDDAPTFDVGDLPGDSWRRIADYQVSDTNRPLVHAMVRILGEGTAPESNAALLALGRQRLGVTAR